MLYGLPLVSGITLALLMGAESDARAAMGFFVGLLGAFAGLRWMSSRSIFGAVKVFNRLPGFLLEASSVCSFQKQLTERARHACRGGDAKWHSLYSCRASV